MAREWHPRAVVQLSLRSLQLLFACISAALYAVDLANWSSANVHADPNWIYAEVVSVLSISSCVAQWSLALRPLLSAPWDGLLCLLWLVVVAVFGQMVVGKNAPEEEYSSERIAAAVGIDCVNMSLWLASIVEASLCCGAARQVKRQKKVEAKQQERDFEMEKIQTPEENPPAYTD